MDRERINSLINRLLLPGLAFKAVVIGGGYATGRELVEFFLKSGPAGGLAGMLTAMLAWSLVCTLTFLLALQTGSFDYESFLQCLLGPWRFGFEIVYFAFLILILSVFGAAAGEMGHALFGAPRLLGSLTLIAGILLVVSAGQGAVEKLFKYVSVLLYPVYAAFLILSLSAFGHRMVGHFAASPPMHAWVRGGLEYASYNLIGAALILPVLRHLTCRRDAVIAGLLCGPLAILPGILFFLCMAGFYPEILSRPLPSDTLLIELHRPWFRLIFQLMVFFALLESSVGFIQAFVARVDAYNIARGRRTSHAWRLLLALGLTTGSVFLASGIGLVGLIARGYRIFAFAAIATFALPLFTIGIWKLLGMRGTVGAEQMP
jgi:uncharacterized membrane protein YkvI